MCRLAASDMDYCARDFPSCVLVSLVRRSRVNLKFPIRLWPFVTFFSRNSVIAKRSEKVRSGEQSPTLSTWYGECDVSKTPKWFNEDSSIFMTSFSLWFVVRQRLAFDSLPVKVTHICETSSAPKKQQLKRRWSEKQIKQQIERETRPGEESEVMSPAKLTNIKHRIRMRNVQTHQSIHLIVPSATDAPSPISLALQMNLSHGIWNLFEAMDMMENVRILKTLLRRDRSAHRKLIYSGHKKNKKTCFCFSIVLLSSSVMLSSLNACQRDIGWVTSLAFVWDSNVSSWCFNFFPIDFLFARLVIVFSSMKEKLFD